MGAQVLLDDCACFLKVSEESPDSLKWSQRELGGSNLTEKRAAERYTAPLAYSFKNNY